MDFVKRTWAEISLDAIAHNFTEIRRKTDGAKLCCVIKADGYGHGAAELAQLYEALGADFFAVSNIDEGIEIRNAGVKLPILILGYTPVRDAAKLCEYNISQAVFSLDYARSLSEECEKAECTCKIHIKADTGMSRIGFMCQEFPRDDNSVEEICEACDLPGLIPEGMFTHFAKADEEDHGPTHAQIELYTGFRNRIREELGFEIPLCHCSNSAGIIEFPEANMNLVRAGITLYGLWPSSEVSRTIVPLRPVMTLYSRIVYIKEAGPGVSVSYGGIYTTSAEMTRIATIPVGYGDGYPRSLSGKGYVLVCGKKAPILGRVCMDQMMVDVTDIPEAKEGSLVTLIGKDARESITMEQLGDLSGRFNYELACNINQRVPRIVCGGTLG